MEVVIPLVALGGLFIVSNQSKKEKGVEGFKNLPNTDVPDKNYPTDEIVEPETELSSRLSTTNKYDGGAAYTDKYFNPLVQNNMITKKADADKNQYYSLAGEQVESEYFKHSNMMPFFGGKIRSAVNEKANEAVMDNYLGSGSQFISKTEQSPLFSPNEKYQWAHGAPNSNDFYQSRVNPSTKMSGVKPFEEVKVGPGLGLGYTAEGSGGYNSGTMMRESWQPKTVDDLRTANKQKSTETMLINHEGPAMSRITNVGIIGAYQKNRPETSFEWSHDRLFTTTGAEKGQTMHAIPVERHVVRPETTTDYGGVSQSIHHQSATPGEVMPSHRIELGQKQLGVANANGRSFASEGDYGSKSFQMYNNNRTSNKNNEDYFGSVKSGIGAVVAPLLEMMRPSRKENVTGNMRVYGDAKTAVNQSYLYNPNDAPAATIRETTGEAPIHMNVNRGQTNNGYLSTAATIVSQERDSTLVSHTGIAGYSNSALRPYDAEYSHVPSDVKASTINGRFGNSNTNVFNGHVNYVGKAKELDLENNRAAIPRMPSSIQSVNQMGSFQQKTQDLGQQSNRNTPDLYSALQQNPYALKRTYA
jgi:hypothetical protein